MKRRRWGEECNTGKMKSWVWKDERERRGFFLFIFVFGGKEKKMKVKIVGTCKRGPLFLYGLGIWGPGLETIKQAACSMPWYWLQWTTPFLYRAEVYWVIIEFGYYTTIHMICAWHDEVINVPFCFNHINLDVIWDTCFIGMSCFLHKNKFVLMGVNWFNL